MYTHAKKAGDVFQQNRAPATQQTPPQQVQQQQAPAQPQQYVQGNQGSRHGNCGRGNHNQWYNLINLIYTKSDVLGVINNFENESKFLSSTGDNTKFLSSGHETGCLLNSQLNSVAPQRAVHNCSSIENFYSSEGLTSSEGDSVIPQRKLNQNFQSNAVQWRQHWEIQATLYAFFHLYSHGFVEF